MNMQKRRVKTLLSFSIFLLCASQISIADETKPDFACLYPTILKTGKKAIYKNGAGNPFPAVRCSVEMEHLSL